MKLSIREFARMLRVTHSYISQIELEKLSPPSEDLIKRMAVILKQSPDEFLALAGKVSSDIKDTIMEEPNWVPELVRALNSLQSDVVLREKLEAVTLHFSCSAFKQIQSDMYLYKDGENWQFHWLDPRSGEGRAMRKKKMNSDGNKNTP